MGVDKFDVDSSDGQTTYIEVEETASGESTGVRVDRRRRIPFEFTSQGTGGETSTRIFSAEAWSA